MVKIVFLHSKILKTNIFIYFTNDENNNILNIKEKEKISDSACCGAYGFNSLFQLKKYTIKLLQNNITQKNEFYTSGVIKEMIKNIIILKI
jgi:hypothetical protein